MVTDAISDLLTRLRNAQKAGHPTLVTPGSKQRRAVLAVLQHEGYVARFEEVSEDKAKSKIKVYLRYDMDGKPAMKQIRRISRPGRRAYVTGEKIPTVRGGLGLVVVSTSKGMVSDREARKHGIGGELICSIF